MMTQENLNSGSQQQAEFTRDVMMKRGLEGLMLCSRMEIRDKQQWKLIGAMLQHHK